MPPEIDIQRCSRCGKCVDVCSEDVYFSSVPGQIPSVCYPDFCFHCNLCVEECPSSAIRLRIPLPLMLCYKKGGNYG